MREEESWKDARVRVWIVVEVVPEVVDKRLRGHQDEPRGHSPMKTRRIQVGVRMYSWRMAQTEEGRRLGRHCVSVGNHSLFVKNLPMLTTGPSVSARGEPCTSSPPEPCPERRVEEGARALSGSVEEGRGAASAL